MKAIKLCLLIMCTHVFTLWSQTRSFGTLPLAQKPGAISVNGAKIEDTEEYRQALKVYNKLVTARGDFRYPVPTFALCREMRSVAYVNYDHLEITLEEKAMEVCKTFGPDTEAAIAFLLGHELTHYYEKHAWQRGFAAEFKDLPIGVTIDSLFDDVAHETEADYLGGFLAYSAGYGLFDKGAELIQRIYKAYNLPEKLNGYPSMSDRQALTTRTAQQLKQLVDVFEMANMLTAIGHYTEAYEYYRYVLMQYQSRELYNNLGVTAVMEAINRYFEEKELKYRYPIQLDLETTLVHGYGTVDARNVLLNQALLHFDAAISMDPNYAPAYLNKACTYALMGDTLRARFFAENEAKPAAFRGDYPKTLIDVDILIGILETKGGNKEQARQLFQMAADSGSALAAYNLSMLNREKSVPEEMKLSISIPKVEKIDGQSMKDVAANMLVDYDKIIRLSQYLVFYQNPKQGPQSKLFASKNKQTGEVTKFHITNASYTGQTARGLGIGAGRNELIQAYGEPRRSVETPRSQILVYPNVLFVLGKGDKVERWGTYE
ncbi:MAG: tetratricopeptide repeat protein [Saprospiraceae bacterium]